MVFVFLPGCGLSGHARPLGGWFHCSTKSKLQLPNRLLQSGGFNDVVDRGKNNLRAFRISHLVEVGVNECVKLHPLQLITDEG